MSRYSEKLERRREEAAREIEKNETAARHAAVAALAAPAPEAPKPAPEFAGSDTAPGCLVLDLATALDRVDIALHAADGLVAVATKGLAKSEALSVRNSLWSARQKIAGLHVRAKRFYAIAKEEASHA